MFMSSIKQVTPGPDLIWTRLQQRQAAMLVALPPSIHRLRMSSIDYHGDATSSNSENKTSSVIRGGVSPVTNPGDMTTTSAKNRPKLSLQTSSLPSPYAKSSKGVSGSASIIPGTAAPTTSNTIANSDQAIPLRPSPATPKSSFSRPSQSRPYTQPIGLRSILKNGPESPKLGIKRSHSLFSADSSSPHTTRRVFFPPVKKVKFEGDAKLAVAIPTEKPTSSPEPSPAESEMSVPEEANPNGETVSDKQTRADTPKVIVAVPAQVRAAPRTRNGTPPPAAAPSRKKRKVRTWEWTITSPKLPRTEDGSEKPPETF